ncbi:hypothetical protein ATANTOWER_018630, partial [Ataeniobius toweri]|nr:hypothetical protein [Ataeniobius toweri]
GSQHVSARVLAFSVTVSMTTWMLPRPATDRLCLWRPRSKFPTKYLCKTRLYSSMLFPPARLPLLLAVCQQQTTLPTLSRPCLFL